MKHYVYRIDNLINGKYYIGKHSAKSLDNDYMGSGKLIIKAIDKWGIENFKKTILKTFPTSAEAFDYEAELVTQELVDDPMCYNLKKGGEGGSTKQFTDEEIKERRNSDYHNYYNNHKEERLAYARLWYENNKESTRLRTLKWKEEHKERNRQLNRESARRCKARKKAEEQAQINHETE